MPATAIPCLALRPIEVGLGSGLLAMVPLVAALTVAAMQINAVCTLIH